MKLTRRHWLLIALIVLATITIEWWMGRLPFGPDGRFGWFEGDIWSAAQSQRVADPYSVTHLAHGFLFYGLLFLVARRQPVTIRLMAAITLEAIWEILENSPIVIDRYRAVTIAQGYVGDSILNSVSDVLMAAIGFLMAWRLRVAVSLALVVVAEILMVYFYRDNLTLNIVMLLWPIDAIREWQMAGR
jgi:Protein of unknown function (DUF2585)